MFRRFALACALPMTFLALAAPGGALDTDRIHFSLETGRKDPGRVQVRFESGVEGRNHNSWSTGLMPSDLIGLEVSSFRGSGTRPLHFAVVRDAGRLECAGRGGESHAWGDCSFTLDPGFARLLQSRGIGAPSREQAFSLMAVNVRRDLIDAVADAHYPTPSIGNLTALAALGVDRNYITGMSRAGYRPQSIQSLVEFKALGITPEWIGGFARIGYANVPGDGLVQMRALGITPDYIGGFQRIGYRDLPVNMLVQLKALNISPDFVRSVVRAGEPMPPVNHLVQLKLFSDRH
jgi:hypothetical protein